MRGQLTFSVTFFFWSGSAWTHAASSLFFACETFFFLSQSAWTRAAKCLTVRRPKRLFFQQVVLDENVEAEGAEYCDIAAVIPSPGEHDLAAYAADMTGYEVRG